MEKTYDIDYYVVSGKDAYDEHSFKKMYAQMPVSFSTSDETVIPQKDQYVMVLEENGTTVLLHVLDVVLEVRLAIDQNQTLWNDSPNKKPCIIGAMVVVEKIG